MKLNKDEPQPQDGGNKFVSRADAIFLMVASSVVAVISTVLTIVGIVQSFTAPVTLELPISSMQRTVSGLELEATGHFTSLEATVPVLPEGPATLLAWGAALNQVGMLALLTLMFVLAHRLYSAILFTTGSVWIVGACGAVLAVATTLGQVLDGRARVGLAEMIGANGREPGATYLISTEFDLWPLMVGLVLVLVAGVFQYGRRLQTDTEGLV